MGGWKGICRSGKNVYKIFSNPSDWYPIIV